jgi:pimeloyl-ACP methyl ester carboxylesterase
VEGAILLSPPLHRATDVHLSEWASAGKPLTVLVPEHDDYLQPAAAAERFRLVPQARLVGVDGAKHLWVGEKYAARVLNEIVDDVTEQGAGPDGLPQEWNGPVASAAP